MLPIFDARVAVVTDGPNAAATVASAPILPKKFDALRVETIRTCSSAASMVASMASGPACGIACHRLRFDHRVSRRPRTMSSPRAAAGIATSAVATPPPGDRFVSKVRGANCWFGSGSSNASLACCWPFSLRLPCVARAGPLSSSVGDRVDQSLPHITRAPTRVRRPRPKDRVYVSLRRAVEAQLQRMAEGRADGVITVDYVAYYHFAAGEFVCCDMRCHSRQNRNAATWNGTVRNRALRIFFCAGAVALVPLFAVGISAPPALVRCLRFA